MALSICEQLDNFVSSYVENASEGVLSIPYDEEWPSLCYNSEGEQGLQGQIVPWQPVKQTQPLSFDFSDPFPKVRLLMLYGRNSSLNSAV